jgi:hypothetical protein
VPLAWLRGMLQTAPEQRFSSETLCEHIAKSSQDSTISLSFTGRCCTEEEESSEDVWSSEDDNSQEVLRPRLSEDEVRAPQSTTTTELLSTSSTPPPPPLIHSSEGEQPSALVAPIETVSSTYDCIGRAEGSMPPLSEKTQKSPNDSRTNQHASPALEQPFSVGARSTWHTEAYSEAGNLDSEVDMPSYMSHLALIHPAFALQADHSAMNPQVKRKIPMERLSDASKIAAPNKSEVASSILPSAAITLDERKKVRSKRSQSRFSGFVFPQNSTPAERPSESALTGFDYVAKRPHNDPSNEEAQLRLMNPRLPSLSRSFSDPPEQNKESSSDAASTIERSRSDGTVNIPGQPLHSPQNEFATLRRPISNLHFEATSTNEFMCRLYKLNIDLWERKPLRTILDAQSDLRPMLEVITPMTIQKYHDHSVHFRHILELELAASPPTAFGAVAKVLDELGFAYEMRGHGLSCSYPRELASRAHSHIQSSPLSSPISRDQLDSSLLRRDELAHQYMREHLDAVLEDWSAHMYRCMPNKEDSSTPKTGKWWFSKTVWRWFGPSILFHDSRLRLNIELFKPSTQSHVLEKVVKGDFATETMNTRKESAPKPWKIVFTSGHSNPDSLDRFLTRAIASRLPGSTFGLGGNEKYRKRLHRLWWELGAASKEISDVETMKLIRFNYPGQSTLG